MELDFSLRAKGEAVGVEEVKIETETSKRPTESPASGNDLMKEVLERANLKKALEQVVENKGGPGVDKMTVDKLKDHLWKHWPQIREELLTGKYKPQPVRRAQIPKPGGGKRDLGIPTVLDRFIQQAILQTLQKRFDATFSDSSFGFRPGRSAHQAVKKAQEYVESGCEYVVDIDLEKFFDNVNHDKLMGLLSRRIEDKTLLRLIRKYLNAGVMKDGLTSPTEKGTPQGGPLSPLLSNVMLDELDKELERRGHKFVRYADDCNIYVKSEKAGRRVMESIGKYVHTKLKLKINESKSAVDKPENRKFLGFTIGHRRKNGKCSRKISKEALKKFKTRIREMTSRSHLGFIELLKRLKRYLYGWLAYFGLCETPRILEELEGWIRRRLRCLIWKHWKRGKRYSNLIKRGVDKLMAWNVACGKFGPWRASHTAAMSKAYPNSWFASFGLPDFKSRMKA
jgi:RNA-directed DNA polymerase